jgi:hypothetical protein
MLLFNSCNDNDKQEDIPIVGINPFYGYSISISFIDASGNDLVKGLEVYEQGTIVERRWENGTSGGELDISGRVKRELYTLETVFPDGIPDPSKPQSNPYAILEIPFPTLYYSPIYLNYATAETMDDYNYFLMGASSYKRYDFPEKIIIRFTCPHVFGDNEAHDIVTYWKLHVDKIYVDKQLWIDLNNPRYKVGDYIENIYPKCSRLEYGGKEFIINSDPYYGQYATIVLDR